MLSIFFFQHKVTVSGLALDETGDFVASCSDDGVVSVSGLYSDEYNQMFNLDQPVKVICKKKLFTIFYAVQIKIRLNS